MSLSDDRIEERHQAYLALTEYRKMAETRDERVRRARAAGITQAEIARIVGISSRQVARITGKKS